MVMVQKSPFLQVLFLGNIGKEKVFYNILEQKNAFLNYQNKKFKNSKNLHFSKETHRFGPKMAISPSFFCLGTIGQENVFYDILER